jgi:hypothetical protein
MSTCMHVRMYACTHVVYMYLGFKSLILKVLGMRLNYSINVLPYTYCESRSNCTSKGCHLSHVWALELYVYMYMHTHMYMLMHVASVHPRDVTSAMCGRWSCMRICMYMYLHVHSQEQ